ncbi:MAG: signal peptidase II, partial [Muribaculaceae bacterium]|nr:signal peptidase II [Muribaculaceae bacterium]
MSDKPISKNSGIAGGSQPSALRRNAGWLAAAVIILVVLADQFIKIYVKTHFYMGEDYEIFPWFHLKFIENNGMAFGLELWNKFLLT